MTSISRTPRAGVGRLLPGTLLLLALGAAPSVLAVDLTVTKTTDTNDGVCDADCSLREAVIVANKTVALDRIILPAGQTFTLTLTPGDAPGSLTQGTGDLDVTAALTIDGHGSIIDANGIDRALDIQGNFTVTLNSVNVTGGIASGFLSQGGGISVRNASLVLNTSSVNSNSTASEGAGARDDGGGIAVVGTYVAATATTTLAHLTLDQSAVRLNTGATGGGILCALCVLDIADSSISGNVSTGDGGGIAILGDDSSLTMSGSTMINNSASGTGRGGAVAFPMGSSVGNLARNRIAFNLAGTGRAIYNNTAIVTARNNWWGCNYGPGGTGPGCGGPMNDIVGTAASAPYLVLKLSAAPGTIPLGGTSTATADLTFNSAGGDTSAGGTLPGGMSVGFSATGGTFATPTASTIGARATDVYTATGPKGTATLSATADQQTVSTQINIGYAPFTDDPLIAGGTVIKAVHITELRSRINAIRSSKGLGAFSWTTPTIAAGSTVALAQHVVDLRIALAQAYTAAGLTQPVYTDPSLTPGDTTRAAHIAQLRAAIVNME